MVANDGCWGGALVSSLLLFPLPRSFDAAAEKRKKFQEKQKAFKKAWRKQLSNLEFAETDAEATEAIEALIKLIYENGNEIPEGVRKMDLDQVYKNVKGKLAKETRRPSPSSTRSSKRLSRQADGRRLRPRLLGVSTG